MGRQMATSKNTADAEKKEYERRIIEVSGLASVM
jgi:hypothetical protein